MAKIFISYRRQEAIAEVGRLWSDLQWHCGRKNVFLDHESIEGGARFPQTIAEAVAAAEVVLVVIGRQWLSVTGKTGGRRLDDPADWVRREIKAALDANKKIIPVLVQDAEMPKAGDLPEAIRELANRQFKDLSVRHNHWHSDVKELMNTLAPEVRCKPPLEISTPIAILTAVAIILATHVLALQQFPNNGAAISLVLSGFVAMLFGVLHMRHGHPKIASSLPIALAIAVIALVGMKIVITVLFGLQFTLWPESKAEIKVMGQYFAAIVLGYLLGALLDQIRTTRLLRR
jgi:hypothetical protein